jgi:hypothetical protein
MDIIAWIVLGLVAGMIAKMLVPGRDREGIILTAAIGRRCRSAAAGLPPVQRAEQRPAVQPMGGPQMTPYGGTRTSRLGLRTGGA